MACSSSLPWCHLQHTIGGVGNDCGSPPLVQQEDNQPKTLLCEAAILSHILRNHLCQPFVISLQDGWWNLERNLPLNVY
ncbi:unnamed protein product [Spirodela intermedia]|uniref:Uncharacterized protein n=1 Tax=Spirodela intermedia TaxID=51605 RepID=A0A7I8JKZ3_SPIIN|nr:unnamed protein product [Spirodela intermedia]CAA6670847.1 unnamed protein product [Spirodela intermedia]